MIKKTGTESCHPRIWYIDTTKNNSILKKEERKRNGMFIFVSNKKGGGKNGEDFEINLFSFFLRQRIRESGFDHGATTWPKSVPNFFGDRRDFFDTLGTRDLSGLEVLKFFYPVPCFVVKFRYFYEVFSFRYIIN